MKDGKIVERYKSLKAFHEKYPYWSLATLSKRIGQCLDGWMDDGRKVRFFADRHEEGRPLMVSKIRDQSYREGEKAKLRRQLDETEAAIDRLYERCDAGEITIEERNAELGWLQNHAGVLRNRINDKFKEQ